MMGASCRWVALIEASVPDAPVLTEQQAINALAVAAVLHNASVRRVFCAFAQGCAGYGLAGERWMYGDIEALCWLYRDRQILMRPMSDLQLNFGSIISEKEREHA